MTLRPLPSLPHPQSRTMRRGLADRCLVNLSYGAIALTLLSLGGCTSASPPSATADQPEPTTIPAQTSIIPATAVASPATTSPTPVSLSSNLNAAASTTVTPTTSLETTDPKTGLVTAIRVKASSTSAEGKSGPFRVGNQTESPLRLALLASHKPPERPGAIQAEQGETEATQSRDRPNPQEPFHWDFAPGEGSRDGLLMALPQGDLSLQPGDVVVAFAQDGSRQYWGPYIVGETVLPYWDGDRQEWQLLIQP